MKFEAALRWLTMHVSDAISGSGSGPGSGLGQVLRGMTSLSGPFFHISASDDALAPDVLEPMSEFLEQVAEHSASLSGLLVVVRLTQQAKRLTWDQHVCVLFIERR